MAVEIKKSVLTQQVQDGWKRKALAEHYEIPEMQMAQVLRQAGLKIRKFHAPKYLFVDDTVSTENVAEYNEVAEDLIDISDSIEVEEEVATSVVTQEPAAGW